MKRIGNVYDEIISIKNLTLAYKNARKDKSKQRGVRRFKKNIQGNIQRLHDILKECNYKNPDYKRFIIHDPKEREIFVLPFKDRIIHHAILQIIGDMFIKNFTRDTYSCIKKRGVHAGKRRVENVLTDKYATKYCLKIDVTKFYPSVDKDILKMLLLRKIKDKRLLKLLFEIIDSADGLPIGSYLSQTLANFYMSPFDHYVKEELKMWFVVRYCDDIVTFHSDKKELHRLLHHMRIFLKEKLNLNVKGNYQIFQIDKRPLDFLGYKMDHEKTLIRPSIKKNCARMMYYNPNEASIASYWGWFKHANCINLKRTLLQITPKNRNHEQAPNDNGLFYNPIK